MCTMAAGVCCKCSSQGDPQYKEDGYEPMSLSTLEHFHAVMKYKHLQEVGLDGRTLLEHKEYQTTYRNLKKALSFHGSRYTLQAHLQAR